MQSTSSEKLLLTHSGCIPACNLQNKTPVDMSGVTTIEKTINEDGMHGAADIMKPAHPAGRPGVLLFIHGGVWIVGNFQNHQRLLRDLVVGSGQVCRCICRVYFTAGSEVPDTDRGVLRSSLQMDCGTRERIWGGWKPHRDHRQLGRRNMSAALTLMVQGIATGQENRLSGPVVVGDGRLLRYRKRITPSAPAASWRAPS